MASSKEMQQSTRPLAHQRSSLSNSSVLPGRQAHARTTSHSLLSGSLNANHRVTRRKSVTNPGTNVAALTAAVTNGEQTAAMPIANGSRRNTLTKTTTARAALAGSLPSPPASLPAQNAMLDAKKNMQDSAIDDGNDVSADEAGKNADKNRARRASDGQPLKETKKNNRVEIRCDKCGKGYKHSSCLTKHLWEHTPEWSYTSKLLISKHQQVQLLEAASVLVAMNGNPMDSDATPPDSAKDFASEPESESPAASGYSDQAEQLSSAETTPPPMGDAVNFGGLSYRNKRSSSGFSRSYQSAPSIAFSPSSFPNGQDADHLRRPSNDLRPTSSGANNTGQDDHELAAAVELLSCSFNSNNGSHGTVTLPADAPPVPPVPSQYLDQANSLTSAGFINSFPRRQPESFTRGDMGRGSKDVRMEDGTESTGDDDDFDMRPRARSDEDDEGVFGRMEE